MKSGGSHCVNYFGFPYGDKIKLICCIANDELHINSYFIINR